MKKLQKRETHKNSRHRFSNYTLLHCHKTASVGCCSCNCTHICERKFLPVMLTLVWKGAISRLLERCDLRPVWEWDVLLWLLERLDRPLFSDFTESCSLSIIQQMMVKQIRLLGFCGWVTQEVMVTGQKKARKNENNLNSFVQLVLLWFHTLLSYVLGPEFSVRFSLFEILKFIFF